MMTVLMFGRNEWNMALAECVMMMPYSVSVQICSDFEKLQALPTMKQFA